ncbi:MAG: DUF1559 domain-containing protein [bacterium]|nr:DUF1559 domain-containing protein [bacterium]
MLAALLLPSLSQARERARRTTCMNNLRQFAMAYEMYADNFFERFPDREYALYGGTKTIYPYYINSNQVFWCPSSVVRGLPKPDGSITGTLTLDSNGNPTGGSRWSDYRNQWYASYSFVFGLTAGNKSSRPVPLISDRGIYFTGDISIYKNLPSDTNPLTGNHNAGMNVLYLDGSVNWVNIQNIDFSIDKDDGTPHMGNVAARPNGYSIVINDSDEVTEWSE